MRVTIQTLKSTEPEVEFPDDKSLEALAGRLNKISTNHFIVLKTGTGQKLVNLSNIASITPKR